MQYRRARSASGPTVSPVALVAIQYRDNGPHRRHVLYHRNGRLCETVQRDSLYGHLQMALQPNGKEVEF